MNRGRVIAAAVTVGVVLAAMWLWHQSAQQTDGSLDAGQAAAQAPTRSPFRPLSSPLVTAGNGARASAAATSAPQGPAVAPPPATAAPTTDLDQGVAGAQAEVMNVDAPEPAQQRFARGGRTDE